MSSETEFSYRSLINLYVFIETDLHFNIINMLVFRHNTDWLRLPYGSCHSRLLRVDVT
jgi:hypothetical protein